MQVLEAAEDRVDGKAGFGLLRGFLDPSESKKPRSRRDRERERERDIGVCLYICVCVCIYICVYICMCIQHIVFVHGSELLPRGAELPPTPKREACAAMMDGTSSTSHQVLRTLGTQYNLKPQHQILEIRYNPEPSSRLKSECMKFSTALLAEPKTVSCS